MMEPRPLSPRKTVQLMVILTILAWATQTLFSQWGFGQASQPSSAVVEIRCEATVDGSDVTIKQLCRWDEAASVGRHADLVIWKLTDRDPVRQIGVNEIQTALKDAGVNLSQLQFSGAASCAVRRSEVDDETFARLLTKNAPAEQIETVEVTPEPAVREVAAAVEPVATETEKLAAEPAKPPAPVEVAATKPALRKQLVLTRPLSTGQQILVTDVTTQLLIDKDDTTHADISPEAIIGQLLVKDMKRGDVITAASVRPEPLVAKDQFITVALPHGGVMIETVARAMEAGVKGQTIKAKNEATREIYNVTVTAPAAGDLKSAGDVATTDD